MSSQSLRTPRSTRLIPVASEVAARARQNVEINLFGRIRYLFLAVVLLFLIPWDMPLGWELIPLIVSGIVLGMPHGAIDPFMPRLLFGQRATWPRFLLFLLIYGLLFGLVIALWSYMPLLGFTAFILMTWWHWGTADLQALLDIAGVRFLAGRGLRVVTALVRGGMPMLVPLIFFPEIYLLTAQQMGAVFDVAIGIEMAALLALRVPLAISFVLLNILLLAVTFRAAVVEQQSHLWLRLLAENALLFLFFAVVPSFLAVGLYFCIWHSLRHIIRVELGDKRSEAMLDQGAFVGVLWRFTRKTSGITAISLLGLGLLYFLVPGQPDNPLAYTALYLVLIAALTFPHTILVTGMDVLDGVWSSAQRRSAH